jgi:hypothetical protein
MAVAEGSQTILERKFHLLTIGNFCAVVSAMEVWGLPAWCSKALAGHRATPRIEGPNRRPELKARIEGL